MTDNLKRKFLYATIFSVAISAILGIYTILFGRFSLFDAKVLFTALTIAGASICGLASAAYLERRSASPIALAGLIFSFIACVLMIAMIWTRSLQSELLFKLTIIAGSFGVASAHVCLLFLARLDAKYKWSQYAAFFIIYGIALLISVIVATEDGNDFMFKLMGALVILSAMITVIVPIFHRLSREDATTNNIGPDDLDGKIAATKKALAELEAQKH